MCSYERQFEASVGIVDGHQRADAAQEAEGDLVVLRQAAADALVALVSGKPQRVFGERSADALSACLREHPHTEDDGLWLEGVVVEGGEAYDAAIDDGEEDAALA